MMEAQKAIAVPAGFVRDKRGRILCERDGAEMVLVPAGEFTMGSDDQDPRDRYGQEAGLEEDDEKPPHRVFVSAFLIDRYPVTLGQYRKYCLWAKRRIPALAHEEELAAIVHVPWGDAVAYAQWAGRRLPTEAEWERAARGTDGRKYPWGVSLPSKEDWPRYFGGLAYSPVGGHPANRSPYGCFDMIGGVWEWCSDWYGGRYYGDSAPRDPRGPSMGTQRVMRGGGPRATTRNANPPTKVVQDLGFRTVKDLL